MLPVYIRFRKNLLKQQCMINKTRLLSSHTDKRVPLYFDFTRNTFCWISIYLPIRQQLDQISKLTVGLFLFKKKTSYLFKIKEGNISPEIWIFWQDILCSVAVFSSLILVLIRKPMNTCSMNYVMFCSNFHFIGHWLVCFRKTMHSMNNACDVQWQLSLHWLLPWVY